MNATISELQKMGKLNGFRLIAGEKGLKNEISGCCVLDYEFDPELKNKFQYSNFKPGLLVFTSFLYAKDKTYLIAEAVRQLIRSGASGLVIRNVYHFSLSESLLRYADSNGFPLFLLEDTDQFIDSIFAGIHDAIRLLGDTDYQKERAEWLLHADLSEDSRVTVAHELFPGIRGHYMVYFFTCPSDRPAAEQLSGIRKICSGHRHAGAFVLKNGFAVIAETEYPDVFLADEANCSLRRAIKEELDSAAVGVSNVHYDPSELKEALEESITAVCSSDTGTLPAEESVIFFETTGICKVLVDAVTNKRMQQFSASIMDRISAFTNGGSQDLINTLAMLVKYSGNLHQMSEIMGLHENTLRQRLSKIRDLTGLDYRVYNDYEQLSLAVRIDRIVTNRHRIESSGK